MAEKHKSKYKAPKDFEKSQKPKTRKDLKDYTEDDKTGGQNPHSTGDAQLNVLRKRDKEMVDTGDMYVKYNDDDRLYKDIEQGDYDPKTAAKRLKKRQDTEEKEIKDVIKDKIENLTREQKERLVREYVRRKIVKVLLEQPTPGTTEPTEEPETPETPPADTAATDATTPPADVTATPDAAATPPMDATATTPPVDATATPTTTPDAATTPTTTPDASATGEEQTNVLKSDEFGSADLGNIKRLAKLSKFLKVLSNPDDPSEERDFYRLLRRFSNKKISLLTPKPTARNND